MKAPLNTSAHQPAQKNPAKHGPRPDTPLVVKRPTQRSRRKKHTVIKPVPSAAKKAVKPLELGSNKQNKIETVRKRPSIPRRSAVHRSPEAPLRIRTEARTERSRPREHGDGRIRSQKVTPLRGHQRESLDMSTKRCPQVQAHQASKESRRHRNRRLGRKDHPKREGRQAASRRVENRRRGIRAAGDALQHKNTPYKAQQNLPRLDSRNGNSPRRKLSRKNSPHRKLSARDSLPQTSRKQVRQISAPQQLRRPVAYTWAIGPDHDFYLAPIYEPKN